MSTQKKLNLDRLLDDSDVNNSEVKNEQKHTQTINHENLNLEENSFYKDTNSIDASKIAVPIVNRSFKQKEKKIFWQVYISEEDNLYMTEFCKRNNMTKSEATRYAFRKLTNRPI